MSGRPKTGTGDSFNKAFHTWELAKVRVLVPRLWMILLVFAPPFFVVAFQYFEKLERSGSFGAAVAAVGFPAMLVSYVVLLCVLKQRRI